MQDHVAVHAQMTPEAVVQRYFLCLDAEDWERLGFNQSAVHTDIVSTSDRTVTALLRDGTERVIYAGGQFQLDGSQRVIALCGRVRRHR